MPTDEDDQNGHFFFNQPLLLLFRSNNKMLVMSKIGENECKWVKVGINGHFLFVTLQLPFKALWDF